MSLNCSTALWDTIQQFFLCPHGTYKCPGVYCIKLRYFCDGFWDCPQGYDEERCQNLSLPGFYRCNNSTIFIPIESVCDGLPDCPLLDDENYCDLYQLDCHKKCICRIYVVSCNSIVGSHWETITSELPYILLAFQQTDFSRNIFPYRIIAHLQSIQHLYVINCNLSIIKITLKKSHTNLQNIDFSQNAIPKVLPKNLRNLPNLKFLSLSSNNISYIICGAFSDKHEFKLRVLNLSLNQLTYLKFCTFSGIQKLDVLDISLNFITTMDKIAFINLNIKKIVTTSHIACCLIGKTQQCNVTEPWSFICGSMFVNQIVRTTIWIVSVFGCTFNLLSLLKQIYNLNNDINPAFSTSGCFVALADFCYCFSLLLLAIIDAKYGSDYVAYDYRWRKGLMCRTIAFLFLFSSFLSIYAIITLAISRYDITRHPILSRFKSRSFCFQIQMLGFFISFISSVLFVTFHSNNNDQLQISLCLLAANFKGGLIQTLITITSLIAQFIGCFTVLTLYSMLVKEVKRVEFTQTNKKSKDDFLLGTVITDSKPAI